MNSFLGGFMFLSKRSNGYYYIYFDNELGKRNKVSTNSKFKKEALEFLATFKPKTSHKNNESLTFNSYKKEFLKYSASIHSHKTTLAYRQILNEFSKHFDNPNINEISKSMMDRHLQYKSKVSVYTAQKHLAYLRSFFNQAINSGYLDYNPCFKLKNFKIPQKLPNYFSEVDFQKLLEVVEDIDLKDLFIISVNTGMRQKELLRLSWNQINLKSGILILDNQSNITKSKKIRTLPLNRISLYILTKRNHQSRSNLVFTYNDLPIKQDFITHKFKKYVRKAKLNDNLKFHSLRHTFASWLVQRGVSIYQVSKLLGHADIKTTEIYAHLRADDLRKSVELLE